VDEALSIIQRAIISVISRTPPQLLKEIILVDDFSSNGKKLEQRIIVKVAIHHLCLAEKGLTWRLGHLRARLCWPHLISTKPRQKSIILIAQVRHRKITQ
jgi:hypothetical protein